MEHERQITAEGLADFARALRREERAAGTEENYLRHVRAFAAWLNGRPVTREGAAAWKESLLAAGYSPVTLMEEDGVTGYPVSAGGLTYGSLLYAGELGEMPDLISAVGTNGAAGYILREDFAPELYTQAVRAAVETCGVQVGDIITVTAGMPVGHVHYTNTLRLIEVTQAYINMAFEDQ